MTEGTDTALATLAASIQRQTEAIEKRAEECQRLAALEAKRVAEQEKANEIAQHKLEDLQALIKEVRAANEIIVEVLDPAIRRYGDRLALILEVQRILVASIVSVAQHVGKEKVVGEKDAELMKQLLGKVNGEDREILERRQSLLRQWSIKRASLRELEEQRANYGVRVPVDLLNEINQLKVEIEELEGKLGELG